MTGGAGRVSVRELFHCFTCLRSAWYKCYPLRVGSVESPLSGPTGIVAFYMKENKNWTDMNAWDK